MKKHPNARLKKHNESQLCILNNLNNGLFLLINNKNTEQTSLATAAAAKVTTPDRNWN